jgi:hypothetical protein
MTVSSRRLRLLAGRRLKTDSNGADGTSSADLASSKSSDRPYWWLTDAQILERMSRASLRLREGGEVDVSDLPMSRASDVELDRRITLAESACREGGCTAIYGTDVDLARELELLDYLIENPNASIQPLWSFGSRSDLWSDDLAFGNPVNGPGSQSPVSAPPYGGHVDGTPDLSR